MTLQFGATALIYAKATAVLPTVAFIPSVQRQKFIIMKGIFTLHF